MKTVDKVIKILSPKMPPKVDFIEKKIKDAGIDPIRWAIIEIKDNELMLSVAGFEI